MKKSRRGKKRPMMGEDWGSFDSKQEYYAYLLEVTKRYGETAKTFERLATAALVLPVVFAHQVLGVPDHDGIGPYLNRSLVAAWALFAVSVLAAAWYGFAVVRYVDDWGENDGESLWVRTSRGVYVIMVVTFVAGGAAFGAGAVQARDQAAAAAAAKAATCPPSAQHRPAAEGR